MKLRFASFILILFLISACGSDEETLTIFAASSLTDAFNELTEAYEAENGTTIEVNYSASSTLALQISEGAEADVFASANLAALQTVSDNATEFAQNRLVVITSTNITAFESLSDESLDIVTVIPEAPIRIYTEQMLEKIPDSEFVSAFRENIVSEEPNVRQLTLKVSLGEADAGVVYATDVTVDIQDSVTVIPVPDAYNVLASYYISVLNDEAQPFVDFVLSDAGQGILEKWGFIAVR